MTLKGKGTTILLERILFALFGILILLQLPTIAESTPSAPPSLDVGTSESRDLSASTVTIDAQGGNVTQVNIDMLSITLSWQGYFGNITGEITLDDADNNTFYNWSIVTGTGEVFATRNSSITWAGVNCSNSSERAAEETYLGQSASDGDSVTNTYNTTTHPEIIIGADTITTDSCYSTNAFVNGALDANRFHQVLLSDGAAASNIVYMTIVDDDQTGFDGDVYDFQLLVGENEHDGFPGPTTYYFWVELG